MPLPQVKGQYYIHDYPSSCFVHIPLVFTGWPLCLSVPSRTPCYIWPSRLPGLRLAVSVSHAFLVLTVSRSADRVFCTRSLGWCLFDVFLLFSLRLWSWGSRPQRFTILTISCQPPSQAIVFVGFLHYEVTLFPLFLHCPFWKEVTIPSPYFRGGEL